MSRPDVDPDVILRRLGVVVDWAAVNVLPGTTAIVAIDAACESDRLWFPDHPEHSRYLRPRIAGEFYPHKAEAPTEALPRVEVRQIRPGLRIRGAFAHVEIVSMS